MVVSMDRWRGKVAIVTGASSGIGVSVVEKLVEEGLQVVGLARRVERVEELAKKLQGKKGKLHPLKADMTKEEDILNAFKWVAKNLGPVHILVNNAGVVQQTDLLDGDTEKWKRVLDTNVLGLCIATREAVRVMRANNIDGHIVHINSISGHKVPTFPGLNIYPASKHAVTALTESLRLELNNAKLKIKITSISPGSVHTGMAETSGIKIDAQLAEMLKNLPMLQAEDVADSVLFTLSTPPGVQIHELTIKPIGEMD